MTEERPFTPINDPQLNQNNPNQNSPTDKNLDTEDLDAHETEEELIRKKREEYMRENDKDKLISTATVSLYRFKTEADDKRWVERGDGKIRVSIEPQSNKYRILLIKEKTQKYGCNHFISQAVVMQKYPKAENAWMWTAIGDNCEDGLGPIQKYLARFSSTEEAQEFLAAVEAGRKHNLAIDMGGDKVSSSDMVSSSDKISSSDKSGVSSDKIGVSSTKEETKDKVSSSSDKSGISSTKEDAKEETKEETTSSEQRKSL
ncbi:hypothetical protein NEHOM01_1478 [Nematocida homosporus]|uniref:uncharacterized protein n=1 Tax=Nematocida homosporus TaxID=1912981 RepID=UPI0022203B2F|nr:uncharacterized protein NEHOM01_1478 [Nematocida homosporus]KAI5186445.1 hypothetical protein NEHOM01_1478 [Nematocida homosporus]